MQEVVVNDDERGGTAGVGGSDSRFGTAPSERYREMATV
jgi:hypothetical protein